MKVWAHRGAAAYAPENTLEAFELAIKMGADGVELDVHLSRDGEIVVAHDERVDRVSNGRGLIQEMTLSEIKELDFGVRFEAYRGAKAPTLREVYELHGQCGTQDHGFRLSGHRAKVRGSGPGNGHDPAGIVFLV